MRRPRHDASGRDQAPRHSRGGQPRHDPQARPREAALSQPGADPSDRRALDQEIRARQARRALRIEKTTGRRRKMSESTFVYVTYIRSTPERVWSALTTPEFMRQYWFGMHCESEWKPGSPWKLVFTDGRLADAGEIVVADSPRRPVLKWRNQSKTEIHAG